MSLNIGNNDVTKPLVFQLLERSKLISYGKGIQPAKKNGDSTR